MLCLCPARATWLRCGSADLRAATATIGTMWRQGQIHNITSCWRPEKLFDTRQWRRIGLERFSWVKEERTYLLIEANRYPTSPEICHRFYDKLHVRWIEGLIDDLLCNLQESILYFQIWIIGVCQHFHSSIFSESVSIFKPTVPRQAPENTIR